MCCGVVAERYHTLDSLTFLLPSGTVIDTAGSRRRRAASSARARAGRRPARAASATSSRRPALRRSHPRQVPDQEHHRLFAQRVPRLRRAGGHPAASADRLGGHAGVASPKRCCTRCPICRSSTPDCCSSPHLHAACAAIVPLRDAGRGRSRADGPRLAALRRGRRPACPHSVQRAARRRRRHCWSSSSAPTATSARSSERPQHAAVAGLDLVEPALFTHEPAEQAALWNIRAGMFPCGRRRAQARHHGASSRTSRSRSTARGRGCRSHAAVRAPRLRRRHHLRARQGRQPAFRHHAVLQRPAAIDQYERVHRRRGRAGRRSLRRSAEGGARHRPQHGALRRDRVGRRGLRDDAAAESAMSIPTACSIRASSSIHDPRRTWRT